MDTAPSRGKRRGGNQTIGSEGAGASTADTPRGLIQDLANASGGLSSASESETPRGLIRGFHDMAPTATPSTASSAGAAWSAGGSAGLQHAPLVEIVAKRARGADMPPPAAPLPRLVAQKPVPASSLRPKLKSHARETGEFPYKVVSAAATRFASALPKPNRFTAEAIDALHATSAEFFKLAAKDYARLATLDNVSHSKISRARVEALMMEQGLLGPESLADAVQRLLDREDADLALGVAPSTSQR
jgi:hypothetical protein